VPSPNSFEIFVGCSAVSGAERFWQRFQGCEESVEEFVRRNLGAEVFELLIEPFCSGAYCAVQLPVVISRQKGLTVSVIT
jgi:protoporphyrinogen oxidase